MGVAKSPSNTLELLEIRSKISSGNFWKMIYLNAKVLPISTKKSYMPENSISLNILKTIIVLFSGNCIHYVCCITQNLPFPQSTSNYRLGTPYLT